ncbi:MFS glucose transporter mfs1 [Colletotrichum sp. SAR 10_86]|nr:MFS glucose transporter mfs1 [Colletotrichum sp. SAR 10_75]KAI8197266.1 MFS glucose transporter mfs1 [Colletotrichum sp. SAR 10_65]KAI8224800.1 MFS glucose transporter mfs1 [Colletotrichum sp. SAR 10_86]KAI8252696.1 MFS glucose transporter mfs1 [Colletotrichum sp. SAR 10_77]KAJ5001363.1 MFS glucose transporter mfs1 [Colletotrichum sp. SAR 10_66]
MAGELVTAEGGTTPDVVMPKKSVWRVLRENPYVFGLSAFASLGGLLFGYDQGVVSGVMTMESFAATFPRIAIDSTFKGWFVSTLLLFAWFGSLINGPLADWLGRKGSMQLAVVIFILGAAFQTAASDVPLLFAGRAIAGLAVGMLTMIVPMYISELSVPDIRGTLVVLQQLSITLGILVSYWLEYGTQYIGGTRCAPDIPYTGGTSELPTFDPRNDVGPDGCTGQSSASWRVPFGLQIFPALVLGLGMVFFPESPRFYLMRHKEDKALAALAKVRGLHPDTESLRAEYLGIKAEVLFDESLNLGRRPLLMCGAAGTFISLVIVGGIIGGFGESLRTNKSAGWAGIAFIYIYDINFSYSFAPIGWVLPSEIFNLGNRSKAMSITTSATWMCNFIIGLVTPDMLEKIGYGTYLFFAAFALIAFVMTYFFVPETRGKSLEEMDLVFGDTAAHEEKTRLLEIAASMGLTDVLSDEKLGTDVKHEG